MANQINLSLQQIATLNQITSNGQANFVRGYEYILGLIKDSPNVDSYTKFFFEGARQVNGNFSTDANLFIRGVTETGLAWDHRLASDPESRTLQIQATSDDIARSIFFQINKDGGIPQISDIIKNDASLAVSDHGQTVGGWAGAFYYWDAKYTQPNGDNSLTVGQAILADPVQYEKFVAINAQSLVDTALRQGLSPSQLMTGWNSQAPNEVKAAILNRAVEVMTGETANFSGSPYNIDGYVPIVGSDERPVGWRLGNGPIITDQQKVDELNARYDLRIQKDNDTSWQELQRQGAIEQNTDGSKVVKFAGASDEGGFTSIVNVDPGYRVDSVETAKNDGTSAKTVFDIGTEAWSSETSAFDAYQRLQSQRVVFDGGSQQVKQYDTRNTHPYTELDIDEDATGKITSAQMKLDGQNQSTPADFSSVGQVLGSALGRALAPNNQFVQLAAGTVVGAAGQKLAQAFAASLATDGAGVDLNSVFAGFNVSIAGAGASSVASFLIAEFGTALHLDGFGGQLFNAAAGGFAGSVASQIATQMAKGFSFDAAIGALNFGSAVSSAGYSISSLLGTYLAHELVPAQTHEGAVAGQLLGAVGSTVGISVALSGVVGEVLGGVLNFIVPGLGSLIGTVVGTLLGDAIGHPAHPAAVDLLDQAGYFYSYTHSAVSASDGGGYEVPDPMAAAAVAIVNAYLSAVKGAALDHGKQTMVGYVTDPQLFYVSGWVPNHSNRNFLTPDDAVHAAALDLLQHTEVIGGDLLLKRAHQNSPSNVPEPMPSGIPVLSTVSAAEQLVTMGGDLSVAQDYENYLNNREAINALIAANPNSAFAAGWIATFARVTELGLNHVGPSDFLGGLVGYLDSVKKAGLGFDAAGVSVTHGGDGSVTVGIRVPNGTEVPGALSVFANQTTQSSDAGGTTVKLVFTGGLAAASFHTIAPGASAGDAGNDLWFGNPNASNIFDATASANAILVGGAQNDVISSGGGWDFLDGGDGNDALYSGGGNDILHGGPRGDLLVGGAGNDTYTFNPGDDGADTVYDDYRPLQWVSGGFASGSYQQVQADAGRDTLAFGVGIDVTDITVALSGSDLVLNVNDRANPGVLDRITLQDWVNPMNRIESFVFADGTALDLSAGASALAAYEIPFGASLSHSAVAENAAAGTVVGTVHGFDLDAANVLSYTLLDSAGGRFAVNASTGVVTVASGAVLNYEMAHSQAITVRTADQNGHVFDKTFTIAVTDVAEPVVSDFDGDGRSDMLWYRDNGAVSLWNGGEAITAHNIGGPGTASNGWHIAGQGDFDGNGRADILWLNDNGAMTMWDNGQLSGAHLTVNPGGVLASQHIAGIGDFDGNGKSDILWRNDAGGVFIWDNGTGDGGHIVAAAGVVAAGWNIAGVGDFDGNGKSDILWLNDNGAMTIWDNGQLSGAHLTVNPGGVPATQHIEGIGDFDGNGRSDILWRDDAGAVFIWDNGLGTGGHTVAPAGVVTAGWHIAGVDDFDGNGKSDILWRHDNGTLSVWDNGQLAAAHITAYPGSFTNDWHIV